MKRCSDSMTNQIPHNSVAIRCNIFLNGSRNIMQVLSFLCHFNAFKEALLCYIHQLLCLCAHIADRMGPRRDGRVARIDQSRIQADNIAFL
mgnify:CR=1 FL=1